MKLTTLKILQSLPALGEITRQPVPARAAFVLARLARSASEAAQDYEGARVKACEQHGLKKDDEASYTIRADEREQFELEIAELQEAEVDLAYEPLALDALGAAQVTVEQMLALEWAFKE